MSRTGTCCISWDFLGGCDGLLYALLAFVVLDYLTGVMCAVADKRLSSAAGFKGLCHKVLVFVMVGVGRLLDTQILGGSGVMRTAIVFFYLSNEGVSLMENAARIIKDGGYATGPDYVEKLCSIIERWRLTEYDGKGSGGIAGQRYYRVRRSWEDAGSQKGAFADLGKVEKCADQNPEYKVFDADGKQVYPVEAGAGVFTVVEVRQGKGSEKGWGD